MNYHNDPDNQYDIMRDDSSCELWDDLGKIKKFYVDKPTGHLIYYKDNPKRFWETIESLAQFELKQLAKEELKCKQTKLKT